mmetsp:Transcript_23346/g.59976  ORF Transcript_23346/g.59976 Transcript_23346/m.59976 type:complete len:216 (-) Transcript_23346:603-1250(-)
MATRVRAKAATGRTAGRPQKLPPRLRPRPPQPPPRLPPQQQPRRQRRPRRRRHCERLLLIQTARSACAATPCSARTGLERVMSGTWHQSRPTRRPCDDAPCTMEWKCVALRLSSVSWILLSSGGWTTGQPSERPWRRFGMPCRIRRPPRRMSQRGLRSEPSTTRHSIRFSQRSTPWAGASTSCSLTLPGCCASPAMLPGSSPSSWILQIPAWRSC